MVSLAVANKLIFSRHSVGVLNPKTKQLILVTRLHEIKVGGVALLITCYT